MVLIGSAGALFVWFFVARYREPALAHQPRPDRRGRSGNRRDRGAGRGRLRRAVAAAESHAVEDPGPGRFAEIFEPRYRSRTIMLMVFQFFQTFGFYGFAAWDQR